MKYLNCSFDRSLLIKIKNTCSSAQTSFSSLPLIFLPASEKTTKRYKSENSATISVTNNLNQLIN